MNPGMKKKVAQFYLGNPIILIDDSKTDETAVMTGLAETATPEMINLMIRHARGMLSVPIGCGLMDKIGLSLQNRYPEMDSSARNYTVSIDANETTTGISAFERALSIRKLALTCSSEGFRKPGHIFPIFSNRDGLYRKTSVIEGSLMLTQLGGKTEMAVLCDIIGEDSLMANGVTARQLARKLKIPFIHLSEIILEMILSQGILETYRDEDMVVNGSCLRRVEYRLNHYKFQFIYWTNRLDKVKQYISNVLKNQLSIVVKRHDFCEGLMQLVNDPRALFSISSDNSLPIFFEHVVYKAILPDIWRRLNESIKSAVYESISINV